MPLSDGLPQVRFAHRFLSARPVPIHEHPCLELVLVTRGTCAVRIDKTSVTGRRGDALLLPARIPHDQINLGKGMVGTLYIGFLPGAEALDDVPQVISTVGDSYIYDWVKTIVDLYRESETPSVIVVGGLMTSILGRLRTLHRKRNDPESLHPKVEAALDHIRRRLRESVSIPLLAESVGVSASHLRTLFRHHVGVSPRQYQKSLRMTVARQRLTDPYPSIKEIAIECGYQDVNLFVRLFRKQHGQSPGRWRQHVGNRISAV